MHVYICMMYVYIVVLVIWETHKLGHSLYPNPGTQKQNGLRRSLRDYGCRVLGYFYAAKKAEKKKP